MAKTVSPFGRLPINPDNLPENVSIIGQGTNRPIGFSLPEITELYWTVKSLNVNIWAGTFSDALTDFLIGGGAAGNLVGALAGLANASSNTNASNIAGATKITTRFDQKLRKGKLGSDTADSNFYTIDGIKNNKQPQSVRRDSSKPILTTTQNNITEGQLFAAGPVHQLVTSGGTITIDFSNIISANGLYWPIINIKFLNGFSNISTGPQSLGGITFGGSVIILYSESIGVLSQGVAFGGIVFNNSVSNGRFLYAGTPT